LLEKVDTQYVPRIIPRRGKRESGFTVNLATIPPKRPIMSAAIFR
jgi:hypothetical protein